ncbi:ABC transporter ATP-binding protein [Metabacillus sp. cB07]|uniref:ABC transporter ATP-binding protein n=1 Tax=Metabacillus sp. cB07 TaxID=2806989 RepID=UPI001939F4E5|nr:ABC transporter ATP-binding protein [Metabacillus sp. cB07]
MKENLMKIIVLFNKNEKKLLILIFFMMILAALLETISIGIIIPFIGIVTNPNTINKEPILTLVYNNMNFNSQISFIIFSAMCLILIFLLKNSYLLFFHYIQNKLILNQQVKLSRKLFKSYLTKPYTFHLQRNTADLLRNVNEEVPKIFQGIIMSSFQLFTEILVIFCILSLLMFSAPIPTIVCSILLVSNILLFFKYFRRKISNLGTEQQKINGNLIKWINQGLGASKEIKVSGKQDFFIDSYTLQNQKKANNSLYMKMLDHVPRYFIETLLVSVVLITMVVVVLQKDNASSLISTMALFAMAAFRLMPSINRVVAMISTIRYCQPALNVINEDMINTKKIYDSTTIYNNTSPIGKENRVFRNSICLKQVSFKYPNQKDYSIRNITLTIPIGNSVAFIGESGAGKTTIVDIILGLLMPEQGQVLVDGHNIQDQILIWQKNIGYIPQNIFLTDDSISSNIAFGIPKDDIDEEAVWNALEKAQLKDFVDSLPNKLNTEVGERGVRLSGGQRQRIGIARALYNDPEIIFMDEATSALDNETEKGIMKSIERLKGEKTLIIIAHRLSTIENCDLVFKINKGKLASVENTWGA